MSKKLNLIIFAVSVLIGVAIRTFMLIFTIEANSGFIKTRYLALVIFMIVLLLGAAALIFVSFLLQRKSFINFYKPNNIIYGITEVVMAAAIIYEAFRSKLLDFIGGFQFTLHKVSALLAAATLIYMCVCRFTKQNYPKVITIIPVVFWISRVITVFTEFAALATVSDTVIETIAMCLSLVVFLNFAKVQCSVEIKKPKLNLAVSMLCAYCCYISSVPRFICFVINPEAFGYFSNIPAFTTFATALFVTVFAVGQRIKE